LPYVLEYYERTQQAMIVVNTFLIGGGSAGEPVATVTANWLNMRSGPSTAFPVIATVPGGTEVDLLARNASATWVKIRLPDNRIGWVNASYLSTTYPITSLPFNEI
jgi:uncharacterized protein YgiM (DUF1202 family)